MSDLRLEMRHPIRGGGEILLQARGHVTRGTIDLLIELLALTRKSYPADGPDCPRCTIAMDAIRYWPLYRCRQCRRVTDGNGAPLRYGLVALAVSTRPESVTTVALLAYLAWRIVT